MISNNRCRIASELELEEKDREKGCTVEFKILAQSDNSMKLIRLHNFGAIVPSITAEILC